MLIGVVVEKEAFALPFSLYKNRIAERRGKSRRRGGGAFYGKADSRGLYRDASVDTGWKRGSGAHRSAI